MQYLSAAGVGTIGVVDDDNVDQSNLQRQILYTHQDIGKNKAESSAKRLKSLNPFVDFKVYRTRLTTKNVLNLFKNYDLIVDGTDNFPSRYLINDAAVLTDKPIIFGSIFKFKGQLSVFNYKNGPTYRCLFPTPPKANEVPNCSEIGVLGVLPGIIGSLQANEVLKIILGLGEILTGKLLTFDTLSMNQRLLTFKKNPSISITKLEEEYDGTQRSPNVVTQVTAMIKVLKDKESSFDDKSFALKYLVHMVGDIHQPMHTGRYSDYGGSKIKVEFLGRKSQKKWTNVHVLWDSDLIDDYKMSYTEYANSLLSYKTVDFEQGDIEVWTNESHQHAKKIYSELRGGELLGFDYVYESDYDYDFDYY